ncbi:MAG: acyltransferase [Bacteroidota bacterium]
MQTRRFDIDWLRVIAIGFLLIYHIAIPFQPWGVFIGFIQNSETIEPLWIPMSFLNIWLIPLLFFVSGMGFFSMRKRNWKALLKERAIRILVPLIAGIILVVPLQSLLWQVYYKQELTPIIFPAHLWFLGNIFSYVLLLSPVLFYLKKNEEKLRSKVAKMMDNPVKLLLFIIPFIVVIILINPESYAMYAYTLNGYVLGFLAFMLGYLFVYLGNVFWETIFKWKWAFLVIGLSLYIVRVIAFEMESPLYLMSIETLVWIYAILGVGYSYLQVSSSYLSEAAYPVYIVHWVFIHLAGMWLFPLTISPWIKLIGIILVTFVGSMTFYHYVIRDINFIRPLFGLKFKRKEIHGARILAA